MLHDITVNDTQLNIIKDAVELYTRLLLGQTNEIKLFLMRHKGLPKDYRVDDALDMVKRFFFPELSSGASYSVDSSDVKKNVKAAFDLYQVLNKDLTWQASSEPLPQVNPVSNIMDK